MKANLPPFYIGQKVVYITGINMPKDSIHYISDIRKICCVWFIGINREKVTEEKEPDTLYRCRCGKLHDHTLLGWRPESFRAVQSFPLMTFSKIKETEKEEILINN